MNDNPDLSNFYRIARIVLWVEDLLTRDYLYAIWGEDKDVHCFVAGGNEKISALVHDARHMGLNHVFGILDRDFGPTNRDRWANPEVINLRLPRHEIENYTLDADALVSVPLNNRRRSRQDIMDKLRELASAQPAWLACRNVIEQARVDLMGKTPGVSVEIVRDLDAARDFLRNSPWLKEVPDRANRVTLTDVERRLESEYQTFAAAVESDKWIEVVDGKAAFRQISEFVYRPASVPAGSRSISAVADSDLAKAVGAWQRENNRVPPDIADLLAVLRARTAA